MVKVKKSKTNLGLPKELEEVVLKALKAMSDDMTKDESSKLAKQSISIVLWCDAVQKLADMKSFHLFTVVVAFGIMVFDMSTEDAKELGSAVVDEWGDTFDAGKKAGKDISPSIVIHAIFEQVEEE